MRFFFVLMTMLVTFTWPSVMHAQEHHVEDTHATEAPHDAEGGHGPKRDLITSPFISTFWTEAGYTIIVFLVFFGVLSVLVWPRILGALRAREDKQRSDLVAAENANEEAKKTLADYQKKLADAHAESRKLIDAARLDADKLRDELQKMTEQEMQRLRQRATEEIGLAKQQAVAELYAHAAELATAVASKILGRQVSADDTDKLVRQSLDELNKIKSN